MTKLQLLHRALNERMMAAVEQIMEMVGGTVQEYEEETMRVRKENEVLKRRLQWMEEANRAEWPGPNEPGRLYTQDELNASQQESCAVSFEFGQESQGIVIKTESTDHSLYVSSVSGLATVPQSTDEGSAIAGTSASFNYGQRERMTWHSTQSYMEPLEFDPTPSSTVRCKTVRGKRQRMSFACPDCGKVFGREQGMLFHMRTHSTERPYAYRKRKACFYGDRIRKRKLHGLSRLSKEISDDRLDDSEQANVGSPLAEHPAQEQEPDNLSSNSDQANDDEGPPKTPSNPVQRKGDVTKKKLRCPLCRQKFKRRNDFDLHLKSHVEGRPSVLPGQEEQKVGVLSRRCFSKVWNYYTKDPSDRVFCNICAASISQGSSKAAQKNTSNLWAHLRGKHTNKYLEAKGYAGPVNSQIHTSYVNEQGGNEFMRNFKKETCFGINVSYVNEQEKIQQGENGMMQDLKEETCFGFNTLYINEQGVIQQGVIQQGVIQQGVIQQGESELIKDLKEETCFSSL